MSKEIKLSQQHIKNKILSIRNEQVMLDRDLAEMYQVETRVLNQAVSRNIERFPASFRFQLSKVEYDNLKSQLVTSSWGGARTLPYAFTEQGVAMLSSVLRSDIAVKVSIQIINAFVYMRKLIGQETIQHLRLYNIENKLVEHDHKFNKLFSAIESNELPQRGIYFEGQVFDAYTFASDLIRKAKKSIILIDNYVDDTVLTLLSKREKDVSCTIYTQSIIRALQLDLEKHNSQYPAIEIREWSTSHDRFLIIDQKELYHIGASLKDLGKKWFGFSRMDSLAQDVLNKLKKGGE